MKEVATLHPMRQVTTTLSIRMDEEVATSHHEEQWRILSFPWRSMNKVAIPIAVRKWMGWPLTVHWS